MSTPWIIGFGVLAVAVVMLAALTVGLMRRVVDALLRLEAALGSGSATDHPALGGLRVGDAAPGLPIEPGTSVSGQTRGSLVVFLDTGCEACQVLEKDITRRRIDTSPYQPIAVVDGAAAVGRGLPSEWSIIIDLDHAIANSWRVVGTPVAFVVDAAGIVLARDFANSAKDLHHLVEEGRNIASVPRMVRPQISNLRIEMSHRDQ